MEKMFRRIALAAAACVIAGAFAGNAAAADPTFAPAPGSPIAVGDSPHSIADADFNRDGHADLATANWGSDNVSILLGDGAGGYTPVGSVPVGDGPLSVAVGDFNRDGPVDLAVANAGSDDISILLGNGRGGFAPAFGSPIPVARSPWYIAVGDLNFDRHLDLAITHTGVSVVGGVRVFGQEVTILLGHGGGRFHEAPQSPIRVGRIPYGVAIADFDHDGRQDLAVANQFSNTVSILLGNGDGTFHEAPGSPIPTGGGPSWVAAADYNGDDNWDLAVTNQGSDTVTILLGNGAGGFSPAPGSPVPVGNGPTPVEAADLNGDGKLDLAVGNIFSDDVWVLVGDGAGGFRPAAGSPIPVGDMPFALTVTPANRDGRLDIAVANYGSDSVTVLLNTTPLDPRSACRSLNLFIEELELNAPNRSPWAVQVLAARVNAFKRALGCG